MRIQKLEQMNQYNNYSQQKFKVTSNPNFGRTHTVPKSKSTLLSLIAAFAFLIGVSACQKEPIGPHPTGYEPSGIQHGNNSNYPDAPQEVMDEFIHWYGENCPIWNWPDYEGPYPDNWSELREQFQQDIINWWHSHGYPEWNGNVGG